jgi:2-polyprenyl-3-methyl-5-hydroxy-6-metoxy-1,4-benzoquinol methylase
LVSVPVDMSTAIDVNRENLGLHPNVLYIQDDITKLYYMNNKADYVFCYGVLQHTPNPRKTLHRLHQYAKPGEIKHRCI